MQKDNICIYMDTELKKQAKELFEDLGLNITTAVNIFLRQCIREQGIPFEVRLSEQEVMKLNSDKAKSDEQ